jgi:hypothetical protein
MSWLDLEVKHLLKAPPFPLPICDTSIRPQFGIQIKEIRTLPNCNMTMSMRFEVDAQFQSDYAFPAEATVQVALHTKDVMLARGDYQLRNWIEQDAFEKFPDEFYPNWGPI